ncbi:hypothetical protein O3P69_014676 [Scylla paramamosain]|uniref:Condensation domain-containing protein n=1 Tax=Scylla paramamosain TaxID=85552 RepID=A0AAW0TXL5_SCYPA
MSDRGSVCLIRYNSNYKGKSMKIISVRDLLSEFPSFTIDGVISFLQHDHLHMALLEGQPDEQPCPFMGGEETEKDGRLSKAHSRFSFNISFSTVGNKSAMFRTVSQRASRAWAAAVVNGHRSLQTTAAAASHQAPVAPLAPSLSKAMTTSARPAEEEAVRWRFAADDKVRGMVARVEVSTRQTTNLTLNSSKPITPTLVEEALQHLYDKVESLRLCFRLRDGKLWIADMPHRKLDFQVVSGGDLEEQHILLRDSPFNLHDGPLWKTRLMPCPEDAVCHFPEVKAALPHQCHILMTLHHAANDGMVVMMVTQLLIDILDSLLQGLPVSSQPVGELCEGFEVVEEEARIRAALLQDPERLVAALRQHVESKRLPLLMEAFGLPKAEDWTTKNLPPVVLDNQRMEKFAAKCRSVGATINAGFTALINTALVELVQEAGLDKDVYHLSSSHPVDTRRLMKNTQNIPLGYHAIPMTQCTATPRNVKEHFWQYVKTVDVKLRDKIKRNYSCAGKCVQLTAAANYMTIHNEKYSLGVGLFSFRGQARLQLAYSTAAVSEEVAYKCLEKKLALFNELTDELD